MANVGQISAPNSPARLSDPLDYVFLLGNLGDGVTEKFSFGYRVYKVVGGSDVAITEDMSFDPRKTGNFEISVKREALNNVMMPIPNFGAGIDSAPLVQNYDDAVVELKVKYWQITTDLTTCESSVTGSVLDSTAIKVLNSWQMWWDKKGDTQASQILTNRPCLNYVHESVEDWIYQFGGCQVVITAYDENDVALAPQVSQVGGSGVSSIGIGPKNLLEHGLPDGRYYIVQAWNGLQSGDPDYTYKYVVERDRNVVPVYFQEKEGGYSVISFENVNGKSVGFDQSYTGRTITPGTATSETGRLRSGRRISRKNSGDTIVLRRRVPYRDEWNNWLEVFVKSESYILELNGVRVKCALIPGEYQVFTERSELNFIGRFEILVNEEGPNNLY